MMTQKIETRTGGMAGTSSERVTKVTRGLLACGVLAGPVYIVVAAVQVLTRDGFDITRHAVSQLSLGDLGWIQITNFLLTGLLVVASAVGMRRVLHPGRGGIWGPLLIGLYGVGLIASGVFVPDPAFGFPPGITARNAGTMSWHGTLHFISGGVGWGSSR